VVFCAAGLVAFSRLNIEAYPNPAPVILEITAQAAGLSAEEMEKYYTIPMEVGLYPTPSVVNIRSTSFYGLSFVRVTFKYGTDYYFALTQAATSLQQNVNLPGNQVAQIQQSSLVGEIYRYQIVGPPHFGLTNLRTLQDYVVTRRLITIPGVVQINSWGGTTKQFNVDADLGKLEAYNVTIPQLITALGNANINVGGREISIGQQSVNIRGIGSTVAARTTSPRGTRSRTSRISSSRSRMVFRSRSRTSRPSPWGMCRALVSRAGITKMTSPPRSW
jgi:cobalt-zinc-cadmium resistance protein CzcA